MTAKETVEKITTLDEIADHRVKRYRDEIQGEFKSVFLDGVRFGRKVALHEVLGIIATVTAEWREKHPEHDALELPQVWDAIRALKETKA